jgi:hypothetical protein
MGNILANRAAGATRPSAFCVREAFGYLSLLLAFAFCFCGCHSASLVDTMPLDQAGMSYDAVKQLRSMKITDPEVAQIARARQSGFPDSDCVATVQMFHARGQKFDAGDSVAGLLQAGVSEQTVLALASLNQLGLGAGELEAMRLAELPETVILEVARHHAAGEAVLAGASFARLKNAGLRESTLLALARHSVPDAQADAILVFRRHGASDEEILRRFAGS